MGALRHVILHHHIFKNAGTTLDTALRRNFGERYVSFESPDTNPSPVEAAELFDFLRSHPAVVGVTSHSFHGRRFDEAAPNRGEFMFLEFMNFRNPIDRFISIYDFFRADGGGNEHTNAAARRLTLHEWLENLMNRRPHMVNDVQVRMLSRRGGYVAPPSDRDLKRALRRLPRLAFIGSVERFADSCIAAEYFLQPALGTLDLACAPQNVSSVRTGPKDRAERLCDLVGTKLYERLCALNRFDLELMSHVNEELERRLALVHELERRRLDFARRMALASAAG